MARTSKTVFNNSGKGEHHCVAPDLRGNAFSFSPLRMMFTLGLSYVAFVNDEVGFFYALFWESCLLLLS